MEEQLLINFKSTKVLRLRYTEQGAYDVKVHKEDGSSTEGKRKREDVGV